MENWFKVGKFIYFHGINPAIEIVEIDYVRGTWIGQDLFSVFDNSLDDVAENWFPIYFGKYTNKEEFEKYYKLKGFW